MTRTRRRFPTAYQLIALLCLFTALAAIPPAWAGDPTQAQVNAAKAKATAAKARADKFFAELQDQRDALAVLEAELNDAAAVVDQRAQGLEQVTAQLQETRRRIDENQARYDKIVERLNQRAVAAFIQGPGSSLDFVLGATSLADLTDRIEFVGVVEQSDAQLAQAVQSVRNLLEADRQHWQSLHAKQQQALADAKQLRADIAAKFRKAARIRGHIAATLDDARHAAKVAGDEYTDVQEKLREALAAQQQTAPSHAPVALPPGYVNPLQVCPVDPPRFYGDGFGAPRYAGGFHLHAGVDLLASTGTPIRAPFDGIARQSFNTLGGSSEYVYGSSGYVYNAHLSQYSELSNGPVHAGDIIGYVGDTGDAIGTPHDHFEYHPKVIPSGWPASSYGYSVVGTAVNPYPLLVATCG